MAELILTTDELRQRFPAFSDTTKYSDEFVQAQIDVAQLYISPETNCMVTQCQQKQMIYLLSAHLVELNNAVANGNSIGVGQVSSASVGGVSVSKAIPKNKTDFEYWLNLTPYGMQLLALLDMLSVVGLYIGGQKENVFR